MGTIGIPRMAKIAAQRGFMCALEKHTLVLEVLRLYDELEELARQDKKPMFEYTQRVMPTFGLKEDIALLEVLQHDHDIRCVCIDVPNGYVPSFIQRVKEVRELCPQALIFAGNVVTGDISQDIVLAGGSGTAAKIGIGPGCACRTREKTGVGRPQASAIIECADACHQVDGFCCSDGGCKTPGDIAKALGCGADFVMCGGIFAGAEEAEAAKFIAEDGKQFNAFYGMSSDLAQEKHFGGRRKYSTTEGREKYVPVIGPLDGIFDDIEGGLKSAMCYIGAKKLKNIPKNCTFYKVRHQLNMKFDSCKDI